MWNRQTEIATGLSGLRMRTHATPVAVSTSYSVVTPHISSKNAMRPRNSSTSSSVGLRFAIVVFLARPSEVWMPFEGRCRSTIH